MGALFACCAVLLMTVLIAAPATQAEGERPPGSGEIPVDQRFLGHFTTKTGEPSIDIESSDREGEVRVSIRRAWGGPGKADLIGGISTDGQLRATGTLSYCTLFGGCSNLLVIPGIAAPVQGFEPQFTGSKPVVLPIRRNRNGMTGVVRTRIICSTNRCFTA